MRRKIDLKKEHEKRNAVMSPSTQSPSLPDVSSEERTSNELTNRIRKLRWIGMDDEAKRLQLVLSRMQSMDSVLAASSETD